MSRALSVSFGLWAVGTSDFGDFDYQQSGGVWSVGLYCN